MTSATNFLQSVLITGCSAGGIGSALAETFHERGLHVFATARSRSKMAQLEKLSNVTLLELDVTDSKSIEAAVEAVTAKTGGKLNHLINNSGQSIVMPALDTPIEDAKKLFDVNLWGMVAVTHAFSPLILKTKGTIVNLASLAAFFRSPWISFYSASKAAVEAYSRSIQLELAPFGVRVITLVAGTVQTNIFRNSGGSPLAPDSMYKAATKEINSLAGGDLVQGAMQPADFARKVVDDVLGGATGTVWRGTFSTLGRIMLAVIPEWVLDRITFTRTGLSKLP
ncbi:SDR family oxidoreductase [Aspergillus alliaceus]|uniref:SDR family oxidoreductase n=1 Tax=Petromyces alliaceus TaxID=209559 RepID=UPI0012A72194|nr:uncharacterized protein BDW43DRAFT_301767 [Aspergillus alliaceus]KAB8231301.1 hypothetical protein BDW43DRAFT_301767 [Aspergillus alliaceus]